MNIIQYLIILGIVQLLYSFIFKWASLLLALGIVALRIDRWGVYIIKLLNYYLYVSILGIITLYAIQGNTALLYILLITATGLFFAFITIGGGMYEGEKEASQNFDYASLETMKYDPYLLFGSIGFFVIVLFIPQIATTLPVQILVKLILWVYELPIIGFLLGIFGFLSMLGTFFQAFIMGGAGIFWIFNKFREEKKEAKENNDQISKPEIDVASESTGLFDQRINESFDAKGSGDERMRVEGTVIVLTLESFGVQTKISEILPRKNGVEYRLEVALGSPVDDVVNRERDIALAVASSTGKVKIQAPIPGTSLVGIFVPFPKAVK